MTLIHSRGGMLHNRRTGVFGWSRCNCWLPEDRLTTDDRLVTCKHCRRQIRAELTSGQQLPLAEEGKG